MVEETIWKDSLHVPTQEWLRQHTVWFEEEAEEVKEVRREKLANILWVCITIIGIVAVSAMYGGY